MTRARGFTLLEVMLSVLIGTMVLVTATGLFLSIDRAERAGRARFEEAQQMANLHRAVSRAAGMLVMSDGQPPKWDVRVFGQEATPTVPPPPDAENDETTEDEPPPPPRLLLESTPGAQGLQRLEVVLASAPVFTPRSADPASAAPAAESAGGLVTRALRGAFEVVPDADGGGLAIVWRVLPPRLPADLAGPDDLAAPAQPVLFDPRDEVLLAEDLEAVRFQCFAKGTFVDEASVAWAQELPGYLTLEVRTESGRWRKWMFELSWSVGPEVVTPAGAGAGDPAQDEQGEGGSADEVLPMSGGSSTGAPARGSGGRGRGGTSSAPSVRPAGAGGGS